jgi:hypothetical protein
LLDRREGLRGDEEDEDQKRRKQKDYLRWWLSKK